MAAVTVLRGGLANDLEVPLRVVALKACSALIKLVMVPSGGPAHCQEVCQGQPWALFIALSDCLGLRRAAQGRGAEAWGTNGAHGA